MVLEVVAITVAVVAILMAVPTLLQMYWGRPTPVVHYLENNEEQGASLSFGIYNQYPNRLLRRLGLRREAAEFLILASIRDMNATVVVSDFLPRKDPTAAKDIGRDVWPIDILFSPFPTYRLSGVDSLDFPFLTQGKFSDAFLTTVLGRDRKTTLAAGTYELLIYLSEASSYRKPEHSKHFVVGEGFLRWIN